MMMSILRSTLCLFCCAEDNVSEVSQLSTEREEREREREREREVVRISQKEKELVLFIGK